MTDNTEPTIDDELDRIFDKVYEAYNHRDEHDFEPSVWNAKKDIEALISDQVREARIEELNTYCKFLNDKPADSIVLATELMDRYLYRIATLNGVKNK